jgi:hypothetical protein
LYLFEAGGIDRKEVIDKVIRESTRRYYRNNIISDFNSSVLKNQNFNKFKNK